MFLNHFILGNTRVIYLLVVYLFIYWFGLNNFYSGFMKVLFTLFLTLLPTVIISQEFILMEFGQNEGMASSQVYDIHQTKDGIIWFATDRGISCFNGYEFETFGVKDGVLDDVVLDFHPQEDGNVYCSTLSDQLFYFNEDFDGFKPYEFNSILSNCLIGGKYINHLYIDSSRNFHFGCAKFVGKITISKDGEITKLHHNSVQSEDEVFIAYEKKTDQVFNYFSDTETKNSILSSTIIDADVMVLDTPDVVVFRDHYNIIIQNKLTSENKVIKSDVRALVIEEINSTTFFVGYFFGGGKIIDINGNVLETFLHDKAITDFIIDREGGYWLSTLYSGVFYIKNPKIKTIISVNKDVPINSLCKNNDNEIFVGYDNGVIEKIDSSKTSSTIYTPSVYNKAYVEFDSILNKSIFHSNGQLFTDELFKESRKSKFHLLKFSEPNNRNIILASSQLRILDSNFKLYDSLNYSITFQDACYYNDDIFLGSLNGVYLLEDDKLMHLKEINPVFQHRVDDIDYNQKRDELYFTTIGLGLIVYNKENDTIYTITEKDGLLNDIVNEIHVESKNEIWICTNSGLNKITFGRGNDFVITGLKSADGLLSGGVNDVEVMNNEVWIATNKGVVYTPKDLFGVDEEQIGFVPRVTEVKINDKIFSLNALNDLSYYQNRIEINFEAVSLKLGDDLIYKYKLEGLDNKWYYTTQRNVVFSAIPYGKYNFKVAVVQTKTDASDSFIQIPFVINPPFWRTYWFFFLSFLSIVIIIYLFFKTKVLSYNKDITHELLRLILKKIKRNDKYFIFREAGEEKRIKTNSILYVKSSGNYINVFTDTKNYLVRCKIGDFISITPDPMEYLRIHRSYIVRIDKVDTKSKTELKINDLKLPVSKTFEPEIEKLFF